MDFNKLTIGSVKRYDDDDKTFDAFPYSARCWGNNDVTFSIHYDGKPLILKVVVDSFVCLINSIVVNLPVEHYEWFSKFENTVNDLLDDKMKILPVVLGGTLVLENVNKDVMSELCCAEGFTCTVVPYGIIRDGYLSIHFEIN